MLPRTFLVIGLIFLATTSGHAQQRYVLQVHPARKVETTLSWQISYTSGGQAKEWELVVARPTDLPGQQTVTKVVVEPSGDEVKDQSALKQPVFRINYRVTADDQKSSAKVKVRTEATLIARTLVPYQPGMKIPVVPPLSEVERKSALVSSTRMNHDEAGFQKWLDTNKLRRKKSESVVQFAERAFLAVSKKMTYKRPYDHDGKASSTCAAGHGDCCCFANVFVCTLRANNIPARARQGRLAKSDMRFDEKSDYGNHVRAEFYADRVGWVPADPTAGIEDRSPRGLDYFGNDAGDLLVFHLDEDLVVESKVGRTGAISGLLGATWFVRGEGEFANPRNTQDWQVRELPLKSKNK